MIFSALSASQSSCLDPPAPVSDQEEAGSSLTQLSGPAAWPPGGDLAHGCVTVSNIYVQFMWGVSAILCHMIRMGADKEVNCTYIALWQYKRTMLSPVCLRAEDEGSAATRVLCPEPFVVTWNYENIRSLIVVIWSQTINTTNHTFGELSIYRLE